MQESHPKNNQSVPKYRYVSVHKKWNLGKDVGIRQKSTGFL